MAFTCCSKRDESTNVRWTQSVFIVVSLSGPLAQQVQSKFITSRTVYEVRERPARIFTWSAFLVSEILIEIPWNILGSSVIFLCWYWTSSFGSSRAGFAYLFYCVVFPLYYTTYGLAIAAISPNGVIASTLTTVLFMFMVILYVRFSAGTTCLGHTDGHRSSGILQTYSQLGWWKWMYYVSPFTYVAEGLLGEGAPLHNSSLSPRDADASPFQYSATNRSPARLPSS